MMLITGNGAPIFRANISSIDGQLFMFNKYYESLNFINRVDNVLSISAIFVNITVMYVLLVRKLSKWTVILSVLCLVNMLGSLCLSGLDPILQYKHSSDSYFTEVYLFSDEVERPCSLFINTSELEEYFHFVATLLVMFLATLENLKMRPRKQFPDITNKKTAIICVLCFVISYAVNFHKFSSLRIETNVFTSHSFDGYLCRAPYNTPILSSKYFIYFYHLAFDLIFPIMALTVNFVLIRNLWRAISSIENVVIGKYIRWQPVRNCIITSLRNGMDFFKTGSRQYRHNDTKLIIMLLAVFLVSEVPILFLRALVYLGNNSPFPANIYPDKALTVLIDKGSKPLFSFQTVLSGEPLLKNYDEYISLFFSIEILARYSKAIGYMCTAVFLRNVQREGVY